MKEDIIDVDFVMVDQERAIKKGRFWFKSKAFLIGLAWSFLPFGSIYSIYLSTKKRHGIFYLFGALFFWIIAFILWVAV
jgi:sulfite exporter TauE/SafE